MRFGPRLRRVEAGLQPQASVEGGELDRGREGGLRHISVRALTLLYRCTTEKRRFSSPRLRAAAATARFRRGGQPTLFEDECAILGRVHYFRKRSRLSKRRPTAAAATARLRGRQCAGWCALSASLMRLFACSHSATHGERAFAAGGWWRKRERLDAGTCSGDASVLSCLSDMSLCVSATVSATAMFYWERAFPSGG